MISNDKKERLSEALEQARLKDWKSDEFRVPSDCVELSTAINSIKTHVETHLTQWSETIGFDIMKDELRSEKGVDYTILRDLLIQGKWREANIETSRTMLEAMNIKTKSGDPLATYLTSFGNININRQHLSRFPCTDLCTINLLWLKSSNGKFGFSVQKDICIEVCGSLNGGISLDDCKRFGDRIGWRKEKKRWRKEKTERENWSHLLTFNINAPAGHLPEVGLRGYLRDTLSVDNSGRWYNRFCSVLDLLSRTSHCCSLN